MKVSRLDATSGNEWNVDSEKWCEFIFIFFSFSILSISPSSTQGDLNNSAMPCIEFKFSNNNSSILTSNLSFGTKYPNVESEASSALNSLVSTNAPLQTTLVSVKVKRQHLPLYCYSLYFYCWFKRLDVWSPLRKELLGLEQAAPDDS